MVAKLDMIIGLAIMKHIISLSGGIGSFYTLQRVLEKQEKKDVVCVFCDTLAEDGDLYRFLDDIEKHFEISIIRITQGMTPFELAFKDRFLFNSRVANCSRKLKSKPFNEWLKSNYGPEECVLYLGIDWTETHRKDAIERNYKPYKVNFPMCEKPYISKYEMIDGLKEVGIEIPRMYKLGFQHNNCKGCCFKGGVGHYKLLLEKDRNTYLEMENKEEMLRKTLNKDVSILKNYTLRELREIVDNQPKQLTLFECQDFGGCGCFVDGLNDEKGE